MYDPLRVWILAAGQHSPSEGRGPYQPSDALASALKRPSSAPRRMHPLAILEPWRTRAVRSLWMRLVRRSCAAASVTAALVVVLVPVAPRAQVQHRRPLDPAPNIQYGYDNRAGNGCTDYNCGTRCYDTHTGTDMPVGTGTPVLASAAGVVVGVTNGCANVGYRGNSCGGYCGNYVLLEHDDGTRTIYCHMQLNSFQVSNGQRVACGQHLGNSASSGSSTGPHLHFGWRSGGIYRDPFSGGCSNGGNAWAEQAPYPQMPGASCGGPPPPPPCTSRVGPFAWDCAGPIAGMTCTQILEAADPHTWGDNYFCSDVDRGFRWSNAGPVAGMRCTQIAEASEPAAHAWTDNFLCVPEWSPYQFRWSSAGPVAGMECLRWAEPADPHTWGDNYLCWTRDATCQRRVGPFAWSCSGPVAGMECTQISEASDPHTWTDNYLCGPAGLGLRWSSAGPIAGMDCTQVSEGSEPDAHTWTDNYLCAPRGSGYRFVWHSAGPIAGMACLPWYEPADPHTWEDNFLCWQYTPPPVDAGAPTADVQAMDAASVADVQSVDRSPPRDAAQLADAAATPLDATPTDDLPPPEDASIDPAGLTEAPSQGCGCATPGRAARPGLWAFVLGLAALRRRRRTRG